MGVRCHRHGGPVQGERAFVAGHDIRRRGISDATGLWQKKRHLADTWCYPPPRLRCGCWEAFFGPSPIAERVGQVDSWARYRTRHGRVWPVLLADRAQGPGSLFQDDRKLHEQQMLHSFWLSLLRQERYIRSMCKDLRSDCEQFVQSLERNLAAGARLHEASEVALLLPVYAEDTGSPKPSFEKELLTEQLEKKVSIFACDAYDVYSDVEVSLGGGFVTKKVTDVMGDWHFAKRKETGAWVSTGIFIQAWKAIGAANVYSAHDWVVKVDPDAVFVPERLKDRIQWMPRTTSGVMLQNCEYVDYGFFGNLEVISGKAFGVLVSNLDTCYTEVDWKVGVKGGKYGPMGEDLFAEVCMSKNGVHKVEAFDVTTDGACPAKRPKDQAKNKKWHSDCKVKTPAMHPFKKPKDWFECFDQTMAL